MDKKKLTASLEDYIEVIYNEIVNNQAVKAVEIARELSVSRASVTEALKKLEKEGLINYGRYGSIDITELGIKKAKEVIKKHKILEEFFTEILKLDKSEARENACKIEHIISPKAFSRLEKFLKFAKNKSFVDEFIAK